MASLPPPYLSSTGTSSGGLFCKNLLSPISFSSNAKNCGSSSSSLLNSVDMVFCAAVVVEDVVLLFLCQQYLLWR